MHRPAAKATVRTAAVALPKALVWALFAVAGVSPATAAAQRHMSTAGHPATVCSSGTDVIGQNQVWAPADASAYLVGCTLEVASGATLTIEKETVIKFFGAGQIYVAPGGALSAEGCPQPPHRAGHPWHPVPCPKRRIVFTTISDNSVGGATAPPGSAGSTGEYSHAIIMDGQSSVYVDYADVRHAANTVQDGDPLVIAGCAAQGRMSLVLTDTTTVGPVSIGQCNGPSGASRFDVRGDTFSLAAGTTALALAGKPSDAVTISSDRFDYTGSTPTVAVDTNQLAIQGITLDGASTSHFSSRGPTMVDLQNGSVPAGRAWGFASPDGVLLEGQVAVAGRTLLSAGAQLSQAVMTLSRAGHLTASGTPRHPVRFENGSWIDLTGSGTLAVSHAAFEAEPSYAIWEVGCAADRSESVRITQSTFAAPTQIGNCDRGGGDDFRITQNRFAVPDSSTALALTVPELNFANPRGAGRLMVTANVFAPTRAKLTQAGPPEMSVYGWPVQGIDLTGHSLNRFAGTGNGRVLDLSATEVPRGASWTAGPAAGAVVELQTEYYFGNPGLAVLGRLVLEPGTIIKIGVGAVQAGGYGVGYGIDLGNAGALIADGTKGRPVQFTSMNDRSAGGASYGVSTTPSQKDYKWAVSTSEGSTVQVSHAVFRYGLFAFQMNCSDTPRDRGSFRLTDSVIRDEIELGNCDGAKARYTPVLQRDQFPFSGAPSGNFAAGGGYDPSALQPALLLYNLDPSGVALSGPSSNDFDGSGAGRVVAVSGTTIPSGRQWTVSGGSKAVLATWPDLNYLSGPGITVDGHLKLSDGAIVKSDIGGIAVDVAKPGGLTLDGGAKRPVTFTAIGDDEIGGDSNGDGSASQPAPGAYGTAIQFEHLSGDMPLSNAVFEYASDALSYMFMRRSVHVSHSDFVENQAAIEVEESSGPDYDYLGNVPCIPPWLSGVISTRNWYGPDGRPSASFDLASFLGAVIPAKFPFQGTAFNFSGMSNLIDEEQANFGKGNTVPWAVYSCPALKKPVPVTGVEVEATPARPNYTGPKNARG